MHIFTHFRQGVANVVCMGEVDDNHGQGAKRFFTIIIYNNGIWEIKTNKNYILFGCLSILM